MRTREFTCAECGEQASYEVRRGCTRIGPSGEIDHVVPISRGGMNDWHNLTAACRSCNVRKKDKSLLVAMAVMNHF